jgi:thiamine-phosphate pyrophosphorylase
MNARALCELTARASELTRRSETKLLVNDRADVAQVAGADGVHLTSQSIPADVVRKAFGSGFLIGVSTHSVAEVQKAREQGADFVVFGPVFETESKKAFGEPQGIEKLRVVVDDVHPLPVIAIGGITLENAGECLRAGASGIAAIRLFQCRDKLADVVKAMRSIVLKNEQ